MKTSLSVKFFIAYGFFAFFSFFATLTLGRELLETQLTQDAAGILYEEASRLAAGDASQYFSANSSLSELYESLSILADAQGTQFMILTTSGHILIDTAKEFTEDSEALISDFDYAAFGPAYYETGDFYSFFAEEQLSVLVPILARQTTRGYISVHIPMSEILSQRDVYLNQMLCVLLVVLLLALLLVVLLRRFVLTPLSKIKRGAREMAAGHLSYRIGVTASDELGDVARALNEMAEDLEKTNDYQKNFISNVSHDFRSPLTSIKGFTEAMADGTIPPENYEKYLQIISGEADRLEKLTQSMLTLNALGTRTDNMEFSAFDINAVVKNSAAVFEGTCRKRKISFELILQGESLLVRADKSRIQQALYNLIDNAVKFSEKGGTIWLETSIRRGKCEVSVKDEGCGIASENLNLIWDRFYKEDSSRGKDKQGTGLGLAIVKEIITKHRQTITVSSTEYVGTEFVFTLELSKEKTKQQE